MAANVFFIFLALLTIQSVNSASSISFRWCAKSTEMAKCQEFIKYVNETARSKSLSVSVLSCVNGSTSDSCMKFIKDNKADFVTLDGGRVYEAGNNDGLVPIVSEQYGKYGVKYYGVAIVKKSNKGFKLEELKGKKSCHTGARRTAGWNVPIGYLLSEKIIPPTKCDTEFHDFYSASEFFLGSCVPGVKSYNVSSDVSDKLCAICNGTGSDKCSKDVSKNGYVGYHGSFMCMAEGKGDVSFAKHTTVEEVLEKYPGKYGVKSDYEYLCKDGTRKDIGKHEECFLGFNAAHAVVTREGKKDIDDIVNILTAMSTTYGPSQTNWTQFQLFNSTKHGGANLLFKDSCTKLVGISKNKRTYQGFLGDDYVKDLKALKSCDETSSTKKPTLTLTSVSTKQPYAVTVLLVAMFTVMSL